MNRELLFLEWIDAEIERCEKQMNFYESNPGVGWINGVLIGIAAMETETVIQCKNKFLEIMSAGHED